MLNNKYECGDLVIFNHTYCGNITGVVVECICEQPYPTYIIKSKFVSEQIKLIEPQIICTVGW